MCGSLQSTTTERSFPIASLVFGIVGPIFLIIYFAAQNDPTLKWFGLVITAADVLIALAITNASARAKSTLRAN